MRISDWRSDGCSSDLCSQRRGKPEIGNDHACCLHPCAPHRLHGVGQVEEDRVSGHEVPIAAAMIDLSIIWFAFGRPYDVARGLKPLECRPWCRENAADRKRVVEGKSVSGRVDIGGRRIITEKNEYTNIIPK